MEISANTSINLNNTPKNVDRSREETKVELEPNQQNTATQENDRTASAEPAQEASRSEQAENRNNQQVTRQESAPPPPTNSATEEGIGGQINITA